MTFQEYCLIVMYSWDIFWLSSDLDFIWDFMLHHYILGTDPVVCAELCDQYLFDILFKIDLDIPYIFSRCFILYIGVPLFLTSTYLTLYSTLMSKDVDLVEIFTLAVLKVYNLPVMCPWAV